MSDNQQLLVIREMLEKAEHNLRIAKEMLNKAVGQTFDEKYVEKAAALNVPEFSVKSTGRVVEGIFDGQSMLGADKKSYPVPANYASKSKLIPGDKLKLTIMEDGAFLYKQIGPIDRKRIIGKLTYNEGKYSVIFEGNEYKVLLASVTYFKAEVGQNVTLIVPEHEASEWGAIENVVMNPDLEKAIKEEQAGSEAFDIEKEG